MAHTIRPVEYFHATVREQPGEAYEMLSLFAEQGINLLAFTAVPNGKEGTQLTLFPEEGVRLAQVAKTAGLALDGPHPALLVRGDDKIGVLAQIHKKLSRADVSVFSSVAIADGKGSFAYIVYVRPEKFARAVEVLEG